MKKDTLRAAIYTRISKDFHGDGAGVVRQKEDCLWFCEREEFEFDEEHYYSDNSKSAYQDRAYRPEYERMIEDFKNGEFDIIVVWRVDRLTRSTYGMVDMVKELGSLEFKLKIFAEDLGKVDLSTVDGRNRAIERAMRAEEESSRKSERQKRANLQRARKGRIKRGSRCFGYDGDFNIVEEEALVVQAIYDAYLSGSTMTAITKAINGENPDLPNFPRSEPANVIFSRERSKSTSDGPSEADSNAKPVFTKKWTLAMTQKILRNPRYAGYVYYNPVDSEGKCQPLNGHRWRDCIVYDENNEAVKAVWDAIIPQDKWWEVQKKRDRNCYRPSDGKPINRDGSARKYIGSGVYRCDICGKPMRSGDDSYRCDGHVSRMRQAVDGYVMDVLRDRLAQPDLKDLLHVYQNTDAVKPIEEELAKARAKIQEAWDAFDRGIFRPNEYAAVRDKWEPEIARLEAKRLSLLPDHAGVKILSSPDPVATFDSIKDPGQIASIINFFCTVTLKKHKRGTRSTLESLREDVIIDWKG